MEILKGASDDDGDDSDDGEVAPTASVNGGVALDETTQQQTEQDANAIAAAISTAPAAEASSESEPEDTAAYPDTSVDITYERGSSVRVQAQTSNDVSRQASEAPSEVSSQPQKQVKGT